MLVAQMSLVKCRSCKQICQNLIKFNQKKYLLTIIGKVQITVLAARIVSKPRRGAYMTVDLIDKECLKS